MAQPSASRVEIDQARPPITIVLEPGTRVTFSMDFAYTLAEAGYATLFVQSDTGGMAHEVTRLAKGSGKTTISVEVAIPKVRKIDVIVALFHNSGGSSVVTDGRTYEVKRE